MTDYALTAALLCVALLAMAGFGLKRLWDGICDWEAKLALVVVLLGAANMIVTVLLMPWYAEDVPGTLHIATAHVEDKDLDPTHEEIKQDTDLVPVALVTGSGIGLGLAAVPTERTVHVPSRYSVLVAWNGGEAWLPVEGRLYRKLDVGSSVQLQLREQRQVTLVGYNRASLVAGPITRLDDAP